MTGKLKLPREYHQADCLINRLLKRHAADSPLRAAEARLELNLLLTLGIAIGMHAMGQLIARNETQPQNPPPAR